MFSTGVFRRVTAFCPVFLIILLLAAAPVCAEESSQGTGYPMLTNNRLDQLLKNDGAGKVVIVSFFASWCPPCRKEIPQLVHLRSKVAEKDMLIIGVSADDNISALTRFLDRVKINFPVFLGSGDLFQAYEVSAIPKMVVFNSRGEIFQVIEGLLPESTFNNMVDYLLGSAYE